MKGIEPESESDPGALLLQFLTAAGNLVGRRAWYQIEASMHYPVLFAVLVGATSKGRKGTAWNHVLSAVTPVDPDWGSKGVKSGLSSGEGLIQAVSDSADGEKRLLVVESEFGNLLLVMERRGNTISPVLRQAWDSGDIRTLTRKPLCATGTHISLIGHITKQELTGRLNTVEAANGFGNRILWVCASRSKQLPHGGDTRKIEAVRSRIREGLQDVVQWSKANRDGRAITMSDAARNVWVSEYARLSEGKMGLLGAMTSRAEAYVIRLALIYAILDCSDVIKCPHLKAALAVWDYCAASALFVFGDSSGNELADRILRELRESEDGLTRAEISSLLSRNVEAKKIDQALAVLQGQGRAKKVRSEPTRGRPAERWIAVGA